MKDKAIELAEYLGVELDSLETVDDILFDTPEGDFVVYTEDEARTAAEENIRSSFDDMGLESFSPDFQEYIIDNCVDESAINNFIEDEIDYYENTEEDTEMVEVLNNLTTLEEKIEYIRDLFGYKGFSEWVEDKLDFDKITDAAIYTDGVAHFIAYYDGEEIELPNYFAYRVN